MQNNEETKKSIVKDFGMAGLYTGAAGGGITMVIEHALSTGNTMGVVAGLVMIIVGGTDAYLCYSNGMKKLNEALPSKEKRTTNVLEPQ